jgi:ABC-type branched-subunit amino acid transport system substrate-binding protein
MRPLHWRFPIALTILLTLTGLRPASAEEEGVTADTILFGQAAALAGPSSALGQGMRHGILAAFEQVNAAGGIHGRKLKLVSRDDGYDPDRSLYQTKRLLEQDKVFALIGAVGTPTAISTIPLSSSKNVPFIGPFTGAEFLRSTDIRNVINIRASYAAEAEAWIQHLTEDLHFSRIAIFYQDDSFGRDGLRGVKRALEKRGLELTAEGTFERNTRAVSSALRTIERAEPEAVVMVGTYGPCAEFIKLAHKRDFNPTFVNISFVGANALARELGTEGNGVIVSQVVPFPWDTSLEVVGDYQAAQKAIDPTLTPDFVSLEGYLSGRLAAAALELIGPNPTREALLQVVKDIGRFDIGGNIITFGDKTRDEPPKVFLTVIQPDGTFKPVDRLSKDPGPEVGLQELFLRSSATEKPEADKTPDRREDANARVQDCAPDAQRSSPDGTPCDQNRASPVAAAARPGSRQEQASTPKATAPLQVSRNAAAPRQDRRNPPVQQAAKNQPKNQPKNQAKNQAKNQPKNPHRIAQSPPREEHRQPAPPLAKAAYSFAFGSSCSCATRGF